MATYIVREWRDILPRQPSLNQNSKKYDTDKTTIRMGNPFKFYLGGWITSDQHCPRIRFLF